MEDVLQVYTRPHDPKRPLVCLDETSKQLVKETRTPVPMKPGQVQRFDYEYERNGTANLFMLFAPLNGWRHIKVTKRRTAIDYAHVLKDLADIHLQGPRRSCSYRTISTPIAPPRFIRPLNRAKHVVWLSGLNGILRQSTAHAQYGRK